MTREELKAYFVSLAKSRDGAAIAQALGDLSAAVESELDTLTKRQESILDLLERSGDQLRQFYPHPADVVRHPLKSEPEHFE